MTNKTDAWMPLWIGAYLADTMRLTTIQHGAYLLLLMAYWRERTALPDDDNELRAITKTEKSEWKQIRPVLAKFFKVEAGVWWHKRVEQEIAAADARSEKSSSKAAKAAQARWGNQSADASSNAPRNAPSMPQALHDDVHDECPTPSPLPILKPTADAVVKKKRSSVLPDDFWPNEAGMNAAAGLDLQTEIEAFWNYHTAKASLMADWQAAWRTWCGNARKFGKPNAPSKPAEPAWRTDARNRMQQAVPSIAERSPNSIPVHEFFEIEAKNVAAIAVG